jgi:7,8-dihydropterin-6-yl-methyl-4-(beta-D-ribofuranosyl)aminobenzene 5'-phosphate synthase
MPLSLTVLVENRSRRADLAAGRGFSCWLDDGRARVLFDTGPDGRLIDNAARLGIDLASVTHIVLSHGHYDHSGGLPALAQWYAARGLRPQLVSHPAAFAAREFRLGIGCWSRRLRRLGAPLTADEVARHFDWQPSATPVALGDGGLMFLGAVGRARFPSDEHAIGQLADGSLDRVVDDSALVWPGRNGAVVVSGCAHAGIGNVVESARALPGCARVQAVLGGFHLRSAGPLQLWRVRRYFSRLGVTAVGACHCSGWGRHWMPAQRDLSTGVRRVFD